MCLQILILKPTLQRQFNIKCLVFKLRRITVRDLKLNHVFFLFIIIYRLDKKIKELAIAERNAMRYETHCNELQSQYNQSQAERKKLTEKERELEKEVERLKGLLDDARKHLEEETLQRIDLENNIQSLKEDISFKDQVYQQELTETRTRRQVCLETSKFFLLLFRIFYSKSVQITFLLNLTRPHDTSIQHTLSPD